MTPGTRNDGLRLQTFSSAEVLFMRVVGALSGVVVLAAAATNGVGQGRILASASGLSWQAPGSSTPGDPQGIPADGDYVLEDGEDASKWIRLTAYKDYLPTSGDARVFLGDSYNVFGPDDVTSAEAFAGNTETMAFYLANVSPSMALSVKLWLDAASVSAGLRVSSDGTNFYSPTSEVHVDVRTWASIAAGATATVWVRRIIGGSAASNPAVLNLMQWSWKSLT